MWYNKGMKNQNYDKQFSWVTLILIFIILISLGTYAGLTITGDAENPRVVWDHGFTPGEVMSKRLIDDKHPSMEILYNHPLTNTLELKNFYVKFDVMMKTQIHQIITLEWWLFKDGINGEVRFEISPIPWDASEARFVSRYIEHGIVPVRVFIV